MRVKTYLRAQWDRVIAGALAGLGLLVLLLGWLGVSGTPYATEQVPYILSGGVLGVLLLGSAGTFWLSADLRDEWRKLDDLDSTLISLHDLLSAQPAQTGAAEPAAQPATAPEGSSRSSTAVEERAARARPVRRRQSQNAVS